jgi:hypothetical protein
LISVYSDQIVKQPLYIYWQRNMAEQPTLLSADTDGNGPAKRRRRPALSCVECRMRKVKCDRERPCGACTRIKSSTCTYRPQRAGIRSESERSPEAPSLSANGNHDQEHGNSARSSPHLSGPSNEFDLMINRYVAPGIFGEHGRPKLKPLPPDRPNLNLSSHSDVDNAVLSGLVERLSALECKSNSTSEGLGGSTGLPLRHGPSPVASGQFLKSKYYGQSHWMNAIEPVSLSPLKPELLHSRKSIILVSES